MGHVQQYIEMLLEKDKMEERLSKIANWSFNAQSQHQIDISRTNAWRGSLQSN